MLTLFCVEILKYWGQYLNRIFQEEKRGKIYDLINQITNEDLESRLKYFFKDKVDSHKSWNSDFYKYSRDFESNQNNPPVVPLSYNFLNTIRRLTITSFKWSETIGEKVLAYNPIPGRQVGCVYLNEATGGRAWSP